MIEVLVFLFFEPFNFFLVFISFLIEVLTNYDIFIVVERKYISFA